MENGRLVALQFADGRMVPELTPSGALRSMRYQYKIQDHLRHGVGAPCKPTVVLFEDADEDGKIAEEEVLQRELYYPFGMPLDNYWSKPAPALTPTQDFLYNGKEYETTEDLNW